MLKRVAPHAHFAKERDTKKEKTESAVVFRLLKEDMNAGLGVCFEPVSFKTFLSEPDRPGTSLSNENFIRIKSIKKGGAAHMEGNLRPGDEIFRINGCPINSFGILPPLRPDADGNVSVIVRRPGKLQKEFHEYFINVFHASFPKPLGKERPSTSASSHQQVPHSRSPSPGKRQTIPTLDLGCLKNEKNAPVPKSSPNQYRPSSSGSQISLAMDKTVLDNVKQEANERKCHTFLAEEVSQQNTAAESKLRSRSTPIFDAILQTSLINDALKKNLESGIYKATGFVSKVTARRLNSPQRSRSASPIKGDEISVQAAELLDEAYLQKQRLSLKTPQALLQCHSVFDQLDAERQEVLLAYLAKREAKMVSKEIWEEKRRRLKLRKKKDAKEYPAITSAYATSEKYDKGASFNESRAKSDVEWMIYHASQKPGPGTYSPQAVETFQGCKFSESRPKSDVEWKIYRASKIPGPADYAAPVLKGPSGGKFSTAKPKTYIDWECYRAQRLPGPGEYGVHETPKPSGGRFSNSKPKSDVDWLVYIAKQLPGPGQYDVNYMDQASGGKFNMSNSKSDVEWKMHLASQIPGPGNYGAPALPTASGGKFNESNPKSWVEWQQYRAASIPGPADYPAPCMPKPSGGKFNASNSKSYIDWEIYKAQQIPGPGQYEPQRPSSHVIGGKISDSRPKSDIDWMIRRASKMPGPGQNDPPQMPKPGGGKFNVAHVPGFMEMAAKQGKQSPGAKYNVHENKMHLYQHHSPSQVQAQEFSDHPEQKLLTRSTSKQLCM